MKTNNKKTLVKKPIIFGFISSLSLLLVYFLIVSFANSFSHAIEEFLRMWYWITLLVVGFGFQVGLYTYSRGYAKIKSTSATTSMAVAGTFSTTSMVACCAHHLTDFLPLLGLSAAALFLVKYQLLFIVIGVLSNIIGISIMLKTIQEHELYHKTGLLSKIMKFDMKKIFYYNIVMGVVIILIILFLLTQGG